MEVVLITLGSILVSWGWNTIMTPEPADTCNVEVRINAEISVNDEYLQSDCNKLLQSPDAWYDKETNTIQMGK